MHESELNASKHSDQNSLLHKLVFPDANSIKSLADNPDRNWYLLFVHVLYNQYGIGEMLSENLLLQIASVHASIDAVQGLSQPFQLTTKRKTLRIHSAFD